MHTSDVLFLESSKINFRESSTSFRPAGEIWPICFTLFPDLQLSRVVAVVQSFCERIPHANRYCTHFPLRPIEFRSLLVVKVESPDRIYHTKKRAAHANKVWSVLLHATDPGRAQGKGTVMPQLTKLSLNSFFFFF